MMAMRLLLALLATTSARRLMPSSEAANAREEARLQPSVSAATTKDRELTDEGMMAMIAASTRSALGFDQRNATVGGQYPEPTHNRPEVAYDEQWFVDNCKPPEARNTAYYRENPWREGKKCELPYEGAPDLQEFDGSAVGGTKEGCEQKCQAVANNDAGSTYCCEWDGNSGGKCTVVKSFLSIESSSKGTWFNKLVNSEQKYAKFVKAQRHSESGKKSDVIDGEMEDVEESQQTMRKLVEQVNHVNIEGILRHLLSFYICMRWVPDKQFRSLVAHEFHNVDLDMQTQRTEKELTKEEIFATYVNFDAVPLKCSSGMSVQDPEMIDLLLRELSSEDSDIKEAYEFSQDVAKETFGLLGGVKWSGSAEATEARMGNDAEVAEMATKAHSVLPWDGFIRPSQRFTWGLGQKWGPHISEPDNLFFVCFGPRVSSFPHKRDQGGHFMTDMNMAGCNGLWSLQDVAKHVARIRRLFAPETCLTENMKQKLRHVFLETFVDMNKNFEKKLVGKFFSQRNDGMETIPEELLPKTEMPISEEDLEGRSLDDKARLVHTKYQQTGRLVAGAHTKWIVCDARYQEAPAMGLAGSFFNSPKAYAEWFQAGSMGDPTKPECKTYDQHTGCMRCVFAVRTHPWRCLQRLGLNAKQVLAAVEAQMEPLASSYDAIKLETPKEGGDAKEVLVQKKGVCIVGKDATDVSRLTDSDQFRAVDELDRVYQLEPSSVSKMGFLLRDRYTIKQRRDKLAGYIRTGVAQERDEIDEQARMVRLKMVNGRETHYPEDRFGPLMTFSDIIPERSNVAKHEVDYFYTCPCEVDDFTKDEEYQGRSTKRMSDYMLN